MTPRILFLLAALPAQAPLAAQTPAHEAKPLLDVAEAVVDTPRTESTGQGYAAGRTAGADAARETSDGSALARLMGGIAGGAMVGLGAPFGIGGAPLVGAGAGLVFVSAEVGSRVPPVALADSAYAVGGDYGAGFVDGFGEQARSDRRRVGWIGAASGVAAGLFFVLSVISGGYT